MFVEGGMEENVACSVEARACRWMPLADKGCAVGGRARGGGTVMSGELGMEEAPSGGMELGGAFVCSSEKRNLSGRKRRLGKGRERETMREFRV